MKLLSASVFIVGMLSCGGGSGGPQNIDCLDDAQCEASGQVCSAGAKCSYSYRVDGSCGSADDCAPRSSCSDGQCQAPD